MQAIVLAGGFGTRLKHVVSDVPKPMAPVADRPFLAYLLDYLISHGVDEVMLSVHHMRKQIMDYFGDTYTGVRVSYAIEEEPLGTGGGIRFAMEQLAPNKPVLALNGDSVVMLDHSKLYARHIQGAAPATLALRKVEDCSRYGQVKTEGNAITEFNASGEAGPGYINAGVYVLEPDVFERFDLPKSFSIEHDLFGAHVRELGLGHFPVDDYFIDIGVPEDYARAQKELPVKLAA